MTHRRCAIGLVLAVLTAWPALAAGQGRTLSAEDYLDRLHGLWLGQVIGNYAGRPSEGLYTTAWPQGAPDSILDWGFLDTPTWIGDDDTTFEIVHTGVLVGTPDPSPADLQAAWLTHVPPNSHYIANRQARTLMDYGQAVPATGSAARNMHWYAIDSQITTESLGALTPGLRGQAADLAGRFASITNEGYPVHAAQFYAALFAQAAFESDPEALVEAALDVVPRTSRTYDVIADTLDWYRQDLADGTADWRATHQRLHDAYVGPASHGRYRNWIESTVNTGLTTLALLYGRTEDPARPGQFVPDFARTVEIGVLGGYDNDCNAATAGAVAGFILGRSGLPGQFTAGVTDAYSLPVMRDVPTDWTLAGLAELSLQAAEAQILAAGGWIEGTGSARVYHLPDEPLLGPLAERPDPAGPAGLVGEVLAAGGTVGVSASLPRDNPARDRENLQAIIDGVTDLTYNGRLPYWTYDNTDAQPAGGDFYQIDLGRLAAFDRVIFHEGDILWTGINADPRLDEPRGGFFLDLIVEVGRDGVFAPVSGLSLSEPLDPFSFFQVIELDFDRAIGDAVRIRGTAGGTKEFTSIVELEAFGLLLVPGDANADGLVDDRDLSLLLAHWGQAGPWEQGDFDANGTIDDADLNLLLSRWGSAPPVPEPATLALLAAGLLLRRP